MGRSAAFRFRLASYSFSSQCSGIAELVRLLEPKQPVVMVGHQLGAMMAAQFDRENSGSVGGLVLLEGAFRISNDTTFPPFLSSQPGPDPVPRMRCVSAATVIWQAASVE
jgi:pimeloyl-ACP methyl ester carboxylesterase